MCPAWVSNRGFSAKVPRPGGSLTAVAFAVPHLHPEEILHPEGVTHAALGEGVTAPVLRAVQLTGWGPKPAR